MPRRSAGFLFVIFMFATAAVLAMGAGSFLAVVFAITRHAPPTARQPDLMYPTAQPAFGVVMIGLIASLYLVSAWTAVAAVGLWKFKRWGFSLARVLAGTVTGSGLLLLLAALIQLPLTTSMRGTPGFNPHAAEVFLTFVGSGAVVLVPLGSWMLFYLARARIKQLFLQANSLEMQLAPKLRLLPVSLIVCA